VENCSQPRLGAAPVLSFGSSEEVLALVENQTLRDDSLVQNATLATVSVTAPPDNVSELAFSDEVVRQLFALLIKPEQSSVISPKPPPVVPLPVIAETPGTITPKPPTKPCPNVLQTRSFPQMQPATAGMFSVFTSPTVNSSNTKVASVAATSSDTSESRSWDSLLHLLMGTSSAESRQNSTGSLKGSSTSGFRIPQARIAFLL